MQSNCFIIYCEGHNWKPIACSWLLSRRNPCVSWILNIIKLYFGDLPKFAIKAEGEPTGRRGAARGLAVRHKLTCYMQLFKRINNELMAFGGLGHTGFYPKTTAASLLVIDDPS